MVYGGSRSIIREHVGLDETIAYVPLVGLYPLYGRELNRKVIYAEAMTEEVSKSGSPY